ncbi:MAG: phage Gp37/Gp68 family protein [Gammaproteobacteria bacterium AqS3]|nr:phage Gp37/Gp68 family protein [Gammaproteobacteria bacterium AqS3]
MSSIEWTEQTWNPVTGCTKISAGCRSCYAEVMARRLQAMGAPGYEDGFDVTLHPSRLQQPLRRRKPTVYFVNSMSDLFHSKVPNEFIDEVFRTIRNTPQHVYQILTKRPKVMRKYFQSRPVPPNAWLGTSVENRRHGLPRIDELRAIQADTRFLSIEPLLEHLGALDLSGIRWAIVGGESGRKARPMRLEWVLDIQSQCRHQGVEFFFKQWGAWGADGIRRSKKANGRELQGRTWDAMPSSQLALDVT